MQIINTVDGTVEINTFKDGMKEEIEWLQREIRHGQSPVVYKQRIEDILLSIWRTQVR